MLMALGLYQTKKDADKKEKEINTRQSNLYRTQRSLEGFNVSQKYVSNDMDTSIMLDEVNKKVCILYSELSQKLLLDYKDILESEIIEDGNTITKTSRSSQIGGALLGGILLGGVGAIIGGLSGQKKSEQEVTRVDLKIVVNSTQKPVHIINFLIGLELVTGKISSIRKDSPKYKEAMSKASHWHSLISVLIRRADEEDKLKELSPTSNANVNDQQGLSVADELRKLKQLKEESIISDDEFETQKRKLLG